MPSNSSAAKRQRQNETRRLRNKMARSRVRTLNKRFLKAVKEKDGESATQEFQSFEKALDSATRKGIYHKNTSARKKSRMHKLLNTLTEGSK